MNNKLFFLLIVFVLGSLSGFSQTDSLSINRTQELKEPPKEYDPLAPSKAAFYSAVLPGLGQAYNKKYWKIPLVYAGIGGGIYFYIDNNKEYHRYRDAYKRRLAGYEDDEFQGVLQTEALIDAQRQFRRNKEISILVSAAFYILNIIDANVDAHLSQFNVSEDLSLKPRFNIDEFTGKSAYGLSLNYKL